MWEGVRLPCLHLLSLLSSLLWMWYSRPGRGTARSWAMARCMRSPGLLRRARVRTQTVGVHSPTSGFPFLHCLSFLVCDMGPERLVQQSAQYLVTALFTTTAPLPPAAPCSSLQPHLLCVPEAETFSRKESAEAGGGPSGSFMGPEWSGNRHLPSAVSTPVPGRVSMNSGIQSSERQFWVTLFLRF